MVTSKWSLCIFLFLVLDLVTVITAGGQDPVSQFTARSQDLDAPGRVFVCDKNKDTTPTESWARAEDCRTLFHCLEDGAITNRFTNAANELRRKHLNTPGDGNIRDIDAWCLANCTCLVIPTQASSGTTELEPDVNHEDSSAMDNHVHDARIGAHSRDQPAWDTGVSAHSRDLGERPTSDTAIPKGRIGIDYTIFSCEKDEDISEQLGKSRLRTCHAVFYCDEHGEMRDRDTRDARMNTQHTFSRKWCRDQCKCLPVKSPEHPPPDSEATQSKDKDEKTQDEKRTRESSPTRDTKQSPFSGSHGRPGLLPAENGACHLPLLDGQQANRTCLEIQTPEGGQARASSHTTEPEPGLNQQDALLPSQDILGDAPGRPIVCDKSKDTTPSKSRVFNCLAMYRCPGNGTSKFRDRDTQTSRNTPPKSAVRAWCHTNCICLDTPTHGQARASSHMGTTELEPGLNHQVPNVASTTKHPVLNVWCNKDMDTRKNQRTPLCLLIFRCDENGILQYRDKTTADEAKRMDEHSDTRIWCITFCKCLPIDPLAIVDIGKPPARKLPARKRPARKRPARKLPARKLPARKLPALAPKPEYATQSKDMDEKTQGGKRKRESAESEVRPRLLPPGHQLAPLAQKFGAIRRDQLTLPRLPELPRPPRQGLPPAADHGTRDRPPVAPDHRTVGEHDWISMFDLRGFSLEVSTTDILRCNTQATDSPVLESRETNCRKLYHCSEIGRFIRRRDTVLARTITMDFGLRTWCNQYCVCSRPAQVGSPPGAGNLEHRKAIQLPGPSEQSLPPAKGVKWKGKVSETQQMKARDSGSRLQRLT